MVYCVFCLFVFVKLNQSEHSISVDLVQWEVLRSTSEGKTIINIQY